MPDQAILLVHGMGQHAGPKENERGDFGKEFVTAVNESLNSFSNHKTDLIENHVHIDEFNYDDWLDHMRQTMADKATKMSDRLSSIGSHYGVSVPLEFVGKLVSFESKFGDDDVFYTHWLDVLFYGSLLGANIRVKAGLKIAELVQQFGAGNVHIVAHSLGTAVAHDTLDRLYRPEHDPNDTIPDLSPANDRLGSIWMIANVSRLVNSVTRFSDPYASIVKSGPDGCANVFTNVRHELDPFTWLARFDPPNNGKWLDHTNYTNDYENLVTNLVVDGNTHSFKQYLQDPEIVQRILPRFIDNLSITAPEFQQFVSNYETNTINGAYAALEESFANLSVTDEATWGDFLETAKTLKTITKKIKKDLQ